MNDGGQTWISVSVIGFGILAYLVGAIPFGMLIARAKGVDIRKVGSGNIGATNVFRSVSKTLGILTFMADALKGWAPAWIFPIVVAKLSGTACPVGLGLAYAALAIMGHTWSVYIGFKGGKGVATSAGALIGIAPVETGIGLLCWVVVFAVSRYVSLASIVAVVTVAVFAWVRDREQGLGLPVALTALALLIVWRHKGNIQRLLNGTEHRFSKTKKAAPDAAAQ
jgi:glycerol-3-phosphate acyltransferase PlsY